MARFSVLSHETKALFWGATGRADLADPQQCVAVARKTALWRAPVGVCTPGPEGLHADSSWLMVRRSASCRLHSQELVARGGRASSSPNRFAATALNQTSGAFDVGLAAIAEAPSSQAGQAAQVKVSQPWEQTARSQKSNPGFWSECSMRNLNAGRTKECILHSPWGKYAIWQDVQYRTCRHIRWERAHLIQKYCTCTNVSTHVREQKWRQNIVTLVDRSMIAGLIIPGSDREGDGQIMGSGQGAARSRQTDWTGSNDRSPGHHLSVYLIWHTLV